jgi:hypothetical protein
MSVKPFVSVSEAARRRGVSRVTIYSALRRKELPIDEHGRILRAEFDQLHPVSKPDADFDAVCARIKLALRGAGQTNRERDLAELAVLLMQLARRKKTQSDNNRNAARGNAVNSQPIKAPADTADDNNTAVPDGGSLEEH